MNEFKAPPGFSSAPLSHPGDKKEETGIQWVSEGMYNNTSFLLHCL